MDNRGDEGLTPRPILEDARGGLAAFAELQRLRGRRRAGHLTSGEARASMLQRRRLEKRRGELGPARPAQLVFAGGAVTIQLLKIGLRHLEVEGAFLPPPGTRVVIRVDDQARQGRCSFAGVIVRVGTGRAVIRLGPPPDCRQLSRRQHSRLSRLPPPPSAPRGQAPGSRLPSAPAARAAARR